MKVANEHLQVTPEPEVYQEARGETLGFLIADAARLLRTAFERRIAQAGLGLTAGEARALIHIAKVDGSRQLDIASRMGVEPMTLCAYLDRLQALGLIERQQCCADRRAKRIMLTASSAEMLASIQQELRAIIGCATKGFDEDTAIRIGQAMKSFNGNLQAFNSSQAGIDEG